VVVRPEELAYLVNPGGEEIVFVTNRDPDADQFFNHDIYTVRVSDGRLRRLTATESAEYTPRFSPDGKTIAFLGTRRGLTDLETTMEDDHVYVMNADGSARRELGAAVDNRQGPPQFSPDGRYVYFVPNNNGQYERSSRSSSSIRIFSKGLPLNEFIGFRLSEDSIRASLNCAL
jgi:Tol biopolymer transport system component